MPSPGSSLCELSCSSGSKSNVHAGTVFRALQGVASPSKDLQLFMPETDQEVTQQQQYKVIVLGDGAVGKTSLCRRFTEDSFARRCMPASVTANLHRQRHRALLHLHAAATSKPLVWTSS